MTTIGDEALYRALAVGGATPVEVAREARRRGVPAMTVILLVRRVFDLSLVVALDAYVQAEHSVTLHEDQGQLGEMVEAEARQAELDRTWEDTLTRARDVLGQGRSVEDVLRLLRSAGYGKIDAMRALKTLGVMTLREAKRAVHLSDAWADQRARDDTLHDEAERALGREDEGTDTG
ncbi:hypothetical protein [Deinococcus pimensis]|uniref:hypothetical protein n=1 Tax=Deinococcus pimensis TaxID=309888 RepID=UPI0004845443|nr:hypothetical protein [Deinococcus pimensis]